MKLKRGPKGSTSIAFGEASNQLLSESIAVAGKLLPVASISEEEQEKMSDEEHAAFERHVDGERVDEGVDVGEVTI